MCIQHCTCNRQNDLKLAFTFSFKRGRVIQKFFFKRKSKNKKSFRTNQNYFNLQSAKIAKIWKGQETK
jgi:hypothetical protein